MCITLLSCVVGRPGSVDGRYIARGDFGFFSLTKIVLYASHFVFILSFCDLRIAKCFLPPHNLDVGPKMPCPCLVTPDLYLQHGAGESLGDSPRCPVVSAVRNKQEIIEKTIQEGRVWRISRPYKATLGGFLAPGKAPILSDKFHLCWLFPYLCPRTCIFLSGSPSKRSFRHEGLSLTSSCEPPSFCCR